MRRYYELIRKVSEEVSYEFSAEAGNNAHGYEVASADDIEQRVHLKLLEQEIGEDYFDGLDNPQASIRLFARNAAKREVEARHRRHSGEGEGYREVVVDFTETETDTDEGDDLGAGILERYHSPWGNPESELLAAEFEAAVIARAEALADSTTPAQSEVLKLWAIEGVDAKDLADTLGVTYKYVRKLIHLAFRTLGMRDGSDLQAIRHYLHPQAKRPKTIRSENTALLDLTAT